MSEDLIRRSDAIKAIEPYLDYIEIIPLCGAKPYVREAVYGIRSKIKFIPTIEPKRGEWVNQHKWSNGFFERECSVCGAMKPLLRHTTKINFCPNCGARMKGADDE